MHPQIHTLKNGLTVIVVEAASFPTVTIQLLVGAGSRYETEKNNGIAHFFEHMAFKGSKKYPNSFIISSTIEGEGGIFNAFTSKDHTGYWIKALCEDFPVAIDVLSDMVLNPLLLKDEIKRETGVIEEEINMYEDNPSRKVGEIFDTIMYPNNPLGFEIAGTKEGVRTFTRKTFTDYIGKHYHPENAVLVVAGGVKYIKDLIPQVEAKFLSWKSGPDIGYEKVVETQNQPQIIVKYKKTEQTHFCLGYHTFSQNDPRRYVLSVLTTILGGGMSSRLFMEVRERRGLCYYISTGRELYEDVGNIVTQAGLTNDIGKIKEAIQVILKEQDKVAKGDVKAEELYKAKELLKGRLLLSLEDSSNVASFYGNRMLLEGEIISPEQIIESLEKVTLGDVIELAKDIFVPEKLNIAMIGPYEQKDLTVSDLHI
jgi:predicted Zn-dependent peptidase